MTKTIHFNTKRMYSQHGQRISATLHDSRQVTFYDHDRMIDGEFELGQHCSFDQTEVMHWYDASQHRSTHLSRMDGMYEGGPNAKYEG